MTKIVYKQHTHITGDRYREDNTMLTLSVDIYTALAMLHKDGYIKVTDDRKNVHIILAHMIIIIEPFI